VNSTIIGQKTMRHWLLFIVGVCLLTSPLFAGEAEGRILTFWPLIDYRSSPETDYTSVHALGPFLKYERKGSEREYALRPLYFRASDPAAQVSFSETLYPIASSKTSRDLTYFQSLKLLSYDFGEREKGSDNEFMLFPFIFYGEHQDRGRYFALFPLGGKIYSMFGRDEIRFTLFPLYGQTRKNDRVVDNVLWPVFARIRGEGESGYKFWPIYGASQKEGTYRKRFFLWPIFHSQDLGLDGANPSHRRLVFPFYVGERSPQRDSTTWLWPFFSHTRDYRRDFEQWTFPWPLFQISRGTYKQGDRYLPFYADERVGSVRKRSYLWPVYRIENLDTEQLHQRRDRVLFFLYSDFREARAEEELPHRRRIALWPLYTYETRDGIGSFHTLSLLEPFFPGNQSIERNWSPLWRLYQSKWDNQGNEISSLLWNLYWKERRGPDLAMEVFPLFFYNSGAGKGSEFSLFKGLYRYRSGAEGKKVSLFYLPWGFSWGKETGDSPLETAPSPSPDR
jgi:hypothetical protein